MRFLGSKEKGVVQGKTEHIDVQKHCDENKVKTSIKAREVVKLLEGV